MTKLHLPLPLALKWSLQEEELGQCMKRWVEAAESTSQYTGVEMLMVTKFHLISYTKHNTFMVSGPSMVLVGLCMECQPVGGCKNPIFTAGL